MIFHLVTCRSLECPGIIFHGSKHADQAVSPIPPTWTCLFRGICSSRRKHIGFHQVGSTDQNRFKDVTTHTFYLLVRGRRTCLRPLQISQNVWTGAEGENKPDVNYFSNTYSKVGLYLAKRQTPPHSTGSRTSFQPPAQSRKFCLCIT